MSVAPPMQTVSTLYLEHHPWLLGWLRRKLGCPHNAADLSHDTFVRVLGQPQALAQVREPRAWLTTIARGLAVDQARRQTLERAYLEALAGLPESHTPSTEDQAMLINCLARIDAMLDGLHPKARTVLLLSRLDGLGYVAIAQQMGVSLSTVEKHMATALRHCMAMRAELPWA
ncbi:MULTISPECIES: sigma-70 family RNA polymerase sigma factor [unclassified Rhodoferax]|uniref:sigma-70 family RNA polymerase sigma factor n=1 Tax=unclassified Rhodoferax TaxID=2627954 RepID=UPI0008D426DE|nr:MULTISPECIES: sigma-70 family RNA polymerase sigma factor [unclassified Rhodoferax]OGO94138.1 MAG: RNA polymerase subunit sigma [Curvibacter sp. GWA2_63_95]OGP03314.1 MAG: RNA polymerase subunit sigma [Curvibacter sp. RIFCSPHIGHO2_12_FULL_63_18]PQA78497.1 RNA polymerase subunit sigma [Rhodoferax sp. TS-BS-61-7]HCX83422.1 RNA polymerase subunit sigma [Rhodoferax sp.]